MSAMKPYVIRQGDYLVRVAHRLGFAPAEVWNHPKNADLKAQRVDGAMLKAGDILFVPDRPARRNPFTKETTNRYVATVPKLPVSLTLTHNDSPVADTAYTIAGLDPVVEGTTDADGNLSFEVDVHVREVIIELSDRRRFRMKLGDLDPIDEPSGARQRLTALGLYAATKEGEDQYVAHDDHQFRAALRAFQRQRDLEPTAELDDATVAALRDAYGA
ncbi:MAG: peptidoglycan-binding domain-containing protein [Myxococcota bacterium]